jgi:hypothetical protein
MDASWGYSAHPDGLLLALIQGHAFLVYEFGVSQRLVLVASRYLINSVAEQNIIYIHAAQRHLHLPEIRGRSGI